jgi:hypothetical protein
MARSADPTRSRELADPWSSSRDDRDADRGGRVVAGRADDAARQVARRPSGRDAARDSGPCPRRGYPPITRTGLAPRVRNALDPAHRVPDAACPTACGTRRHRCSGRPRARGVGRDEGAGWCVLSGASNRCSSPASSRDGSTS